MFCIKTCAILFTVCWLLSACREKNSSPDPEIYSLPVPAHFPQPAFDTENPITKKGIELGRRLFYDVRLSGNNKISCATCHNQSMAFTDGMALSNTGVPATSLLRHTPSLINLAWANNGLFWDGGSTNLESQAFGPLTAHDEMNQNLYELVEELHATPDYPADFRAAFGGEITSQNVVKALAQFQRTLISADSEYDRYKLGDPGILSALELRGMALVKEKCQGCHSGELFTDNGYHNNGIDAAFTNPDHEGLYFGRYRISYDLTDLGKFKTPTLRNISLTAPYMHDGRFATLKEVIDHYSEGIKNSETLDLLLPAGGFKLSEDEKTAIISFLNTLSDQSFITNPSFQSP